MVQNAGNAINFSNTGLNMDICYQNHSHPILAKHTLRGGWESQSNSRCSCSAITEMSVSSRKTLVISALRGLPIGMRITCTWCKHQYVDACVHTATSLVACSGFKDHSVGDSRLWFTNKTICGYFTPTNKTISDHHI